MTDKLQEMCDLVQAHVYRGQFSLTDGQTTEWYVNGRALMLRSDFSSFAGQRITELLNDDVRCVGGPATAAIPVVAAVVHQSPLPRSGFYVRAEAKGHGLLNQIEGNLASEVAIVDDTCATGGSLLRCIEAVERAGSTVRQVVCVFDHDHGGDRIRELGYDYGYVLRLEDGVPQLPVDL